MKFLLFAEISLGCLLLSGCSLSSSIDLEAPGSPQSPSATLTGTVYGGQQPISSAHIHLFGVGKSGYGSASIQLLTSGDGTDTYGNYVLSNAAGGYDLTNRYTCTPGQLVYLAALGGNPGLGAGTNNTAANMVSTLGPCPSTGTFAGQIPSIDVNEETTVAAAYALSPYVTDITHIGIPNTTAALQGITNAFASSMELVNSYNGFPRSVTPAVSGYGSGTSGNGTVPLNKINTLANILSVCVNSTGSDGACANVFGHALSASGATPTDVFGMAVNIARRPGKNVTTIFNDAPTRPPFAPSLDTAPSDWTLAITYTAPNTSTPMRAAIDGSGNLWFPNYGNNTLTEMSPTGVVYSGTTGFSGGSLNQPNGLAVAPTTGHVTVVNNAGNKVSDFLANGTVSTTYSLTGPSYAIAYSSTSAGYIGTSSGMAMLSGSLINNLLTVPGNTYSVVAAKADGRGWAVSAGSNALYTYVLQANLPVLTQFTGGGMNAPVALSTDSTGNFWIANSGGNSVSAFTASGTAKTGTSGYTGAGLNAPWSIAVDSAGNVFVGNSNGTISELASDGTALSASTGFTTASTGRFYGICVDGSGNVWAPNADGYVTKFIGLASPVSTPFLSSAPATAP